MYFNVESYLPDLSTVVCFSCFRLVCLFVGLVLFNNVSNVLDYKFYLKKNSNIMPVRVLFFFPSSCSGSACPLAAFLMLENIYSRKL